MGTGKRLIFVVFLISLMLFILDDIKQTAFGISEQQSKEYKIIDDLSKAVISWMTDANEPAALECDKLADSLLTTGETTARAYFIAAEIANLREKPKKAISILEELIKKYPDEKAPLGLRVSVKTAGCFWIATIAKQSGNIAKSKNVYVTLLTILENQDNIKGIENKGWLKMVCNLCLAEIESLHLKRKDLAISRLEAIQQIKKPSGQRGYGYDIYKNWARYQYTKLLKGQNQATQQLEAFPEITSAYVLALTQLKLCGITGEPLAGYRKGLNITSEILIDRAIKSDVSPIDRELARLGYGMDQQYRKNFTKADKCFSELFKEDSYLSPLAGIYLSQSKKAQGKDSDAEGILTEVTTRYPGYGPIVSRIKKYWEER